MNIIEIKDLQVIKDGTLILNNINLNVSKGELLGILGPNGAGKTTLFRTILGLNEYKGSITLFNYKDNERLKVLPFITYIPQKIIINESLPISVYDLVNTTYLQLNYMVKNRELLEIRGYEWNTNSISINKALEIVGLNDKRDVRVSKLSGGELRRALIAKVLITKAPLLILDEPFTALDIKAQEMLVDLLLMLNKELNITIILAAHDLLLLLKIANNIVCMNKSVFFHGSKEECINKDMLRFYSESAMQFHMQEHT
jgi:zinc transport system ATP-binding protein